ncbi:MAG: RNA-binding cell elongation regulator Jag/EloR [Armatimonadota bacterium]|nr:protein jag [bacterium]
MKKIEASGRTLEEAVHIATQELGVSADGVEYEIVEEGTKGFLGLGQSPTTVTAWVKEGYVPTSTFVAAPVEVISDEEEVSAFVEEGDVFVDEILRIVRDVLKAMEVDAKPVLQSSDSEEVTVNIAGGDVAILIGKHGQTLDALQYIVGLAAAKYSDTRRRLILDAEGYRARHQEMIEAKAREYADAVRAEGKEAVLDPQNPRDRRIVHMYLADDPDVYTYSEGEGDYRHVVISPKK